VAGMNNSPYVRTYKWNSENNRYEATVLPNVLPTSSANGVAMSADGQYIATSFPNSQSLITYKTDITEILEPAVALANLSRYEMNNKYIGILNEDGNVGETKVATMLWGDNV